jgi:hypothetical protein
MSSQESSSTLSFEQEDKINTKILQKLVEFRDNKSTSSTQGTNKSAKRRNGVFIAVEDIPVDLEENENLPTEE